MPIFIFFAFIFLIPVAPPVIHEVLALGFFAFIFLFFAGLPFLIYDLHLKKYKKYYKYIKMTLMCKYYYLFAIKLFFKIIKKKIGL
jgi:hypothetical protein